MPTFKDTQPPKRTWTTSIRGNVFDAGGGVVEVYVDRDTVEYPPLGLDVTITWERLPTREEAVRQVIHDALTNDSHVLGLDVSTHDIGYRTAEGPVDPFTTIAKRVLAIIEETDQ